MNSDDATVWTALGGGGHSETVSDIKQYCAYASVAFGILLGVFMAVEFRDRDDKTEKNGEEAV